MQAFLLRTQDQLGQANVDLQAAKARATLSCSRLWLPLYLQEEAVKLQEKAEVCAGWLAAS